MTFSIMITTRNRCDDLRNTLVRLRRLNPVPLEILICADGCSDGTVDMLRSDFPEIDLTANDPGLGSAPARDRLLRRAKGDWVLSLDDDSYPMDDGFFERVASIISSHPEAAVITFPEQRDGGVFASLGQTPNSPGHYVSAYPNCAALMNRAFYLCRFGFPPYFEHMYEEPDYALQCYAASAAVWFEPSLTVRHHRSAKNRSTFRMHHLNARNELWSVWLRCPWPQLPVVAAFRIWRQFLYACSEGFSWALREPLWWFSALGGIGKCLAARVVVPWPRYYAWMKLARNPTADITEIQRNSQ